MSRIAGGIAYWGKQFSCKREDLSSIPRLPELKTMLGIVIYTCNLNTGE